MVTYLRLHFWQHQVWERQHFCTRNGCPENCDICYSEIFCVIIWTELSLSSSYSFKDIIKPWLSPSSSLEGTSKG